MNAQSVQQAIIDADLEQVAGNVDNEIDHRLRAFFLSKDLPARPVEELEKVAHLLCDIADELEDPSSEEEWRLSTRHADKRHGLIEGAIFELLNALNPERAFSITQRVKSPFLVRRLRAHTRARLDLSKSASSYSELLAKKDELQNQLRQARRDEQTPAKLKAIETKKAKLNERLRKAEQRLRKEDPKALASFGAPLQPDDLLPLFPPDGSAGLVDFYLTKGQLFLFFAFREGNNVNLAAGIARELEISDFSKEAQHWLEAQRSGHPKKINDGLISIGQFLHDKFLCSIGQFLRQRGIWQVTFIPHLWMHALPLHLAPLCEKNNEVLFGEQFVVNYASCVQLALTTALRPRPKAFVLGEIKALLLSDPDGSLPAAHYEQQRVAYQLKNHRWPAAHPEHEQLVGDAATIENALPEMKTAGLIDFATHAVFKPKDPFGSGLYLAADKEEKKLWSIDQIYSSVHLTANPAVILGACESGMNYFNDDAEIVAIPPAFISIGASSVLASLWPVEDVSTSYLVERFVYHIMDPGETAATALHEAVKDIQKLTRDEAVDRVDDLLAQIEDEGLHLETRNECYLRLSALRERIAKGPDTPFSSPLFWGAFFVTGCGWRTVEGKGVIMKNSGSSIAMIEAIAQVQWAYQSFKERDFKDCIERLRTAIPSLDGLWLGRALLLLGDATYQQPQTGVLFDVDKHQAQSVEALEILKRAHEILTAQGDESVEYCKNLIQEIKGEQ
jgi:CHAT domain-containing protein